MSVQYNISPSGHNPRCKICGKYYIFGNFRVCQVCGIILCKRHFQNGFCEAHYTGLTEKDKQRVQGSLQEIAKGMKILHWLILGWILSFASPILWEILANPDHEDLPVMFPVIIFVMTIVLACSTLLAIVQRDTNWGEIAMLAKRYEKTEKAVLAKASKSPAIPQDRYCPSCGNYNPSTAKFCNTCGKELALIINPTL